MLALGWLLSPELRRILRTAALHSPQLERQFRSSHSGGIGFGMGPIERLKAEVTCFRGAMRTLKMTTPIAKHPRRIFPQVISELAQAHGDAPALMSDRERLSYRQ